MASPGSVLCVVLLSALFAVSVHATVVKNCQGTFYLLFDNLYFFKGKLNILSYPVAQLAINQYLNSLLYLLYESISTNNVKLFSL